MAEPVVVALGLDVGYGTKRVVCGLDFEVAAGQTVALLGPNGSGKTTVLKALCGALKPMQGHVEVCGRDLASMGPQERARSVAYVPQSEEHTFDYTVLEVVLMARLCHSDGLFETPEDHEAALDAMATADCVEFADRPLSTLSGGEAQRALIARALAQEAPVLLCDEPTTHLDPRHQADVARLMSRLKSEGKAIVVSTHDLNWAMATSDVAVLMAQGKSVFTGPLATAVEQRLHEAVYETTFTVSQTSSGPRFSAV